MNSKSLKFAVLGLFLSFAIFGFFISESRITAQKKQSDILEKAATYKTWKQPVKPVQIQNRPLEPLIPAPITLSISDSSVYG